ncbi:MAG: hypothetical protein KW793_03965 [Candidatus Doudnabacteria bacterium]|nr:hypothetical protein [Candidatus Doudnabacteria bacterium]
MSRGLYSIDCFVVDAGRPMGGYGPSITLSNEVLSDLLKIQRDPEVPFNKILLEYIKNSVHKLDRGHVRINYFEDTWLLIGLHIGGNCACLGTDGMERPYLRSTTQDLNYIPHNIDTPHYASVIVSSWLMWFNGVIGLTEHKQPFAL